MERYVVEQSTEGNGEWVVLDTHNDDDFYLFAFDTRSEAIACAAAWNADEPDNV